MLDALDLDNSFGSESHRILRGQIRRYVTGEIEPHLPAWEAQGFIPREAYAAMGAAGLLGLTLPEAFGGSGMDTMAAVILAEEFVRTGYVGLAGSVMVQTDMSAHHLVRAGTPEQQQRYLPDVVAGRKICALGVTEPRGGSDLTRMASNARPDGANWILNGRKTYITNANIADLFFVVARTDPNARGGKGYSILLLERGMPGLSFGPKTPKAGQHCSDNGELLFDDCRVPAANVIGEVGRGFYTMMQGLEHERIVIAAQAAAAAETGLLHTLDWVKLREAYGGRLWDLQTIRHQVSGLVAELAAAKTLLYHIAAQAGRGGDTRLTSALLKAHVPELAIRTLYKCVQFHGATGYMLGTPVERLARDIRVFPLAGGGTEIMLDEIAKRL
ncbi:acyl-CoA dehydrogenase family protein [Zavarzinia sp. CC-PAN008]|uniref:acyl-CoA dehydrogenase family protein n=1 Tax=Zavarzinia sp. CC-PAN008 TaxID=3243332 RepID=UPI003F7480F6